MPKSTVSTKSLRAPRAASGASGLDRAGLRPALGPGATSIPPTTRGQSKINTATCSAKSALASDPPRGCNMQARKNQKACLCIKFSLALLDARAHSVYAQPGKFLLKRTVQPRSLY